ncbi:MAG: FecR domain-containing protein [Sphingobium sp.]|uniref:FecR family protein n=1 Tax=Sphingobium sp. TaxID=1912891 RepID=UPI0029A20D9D|nr:FecR domain-containing protein [Sphingobium sp.]MDX3911398.1 FecR domain-containing protein [Sphingobium sp.]
MRAIEAEAARLYLQARDSDADGEWQKAYAWIARDPAHGFAFAKAEAGWELAERLNELPAGRIDTPADTAMLGADQSEHAIPEALVGRRALLRMAAAAAVVGVAGTVTLRLVRTVDRYRTALGETRTVRLADGSLVHLNTNSSIEVALQDNLRSIRLLKGEAQFDVAHDKSRPFIVEADGTQVRALGTMFNVRLRQDLTELTVIEGVVAVRNGGSPIRKIGGGKSAAVRSGSIAVTPIEPAQVKQRTAWQEGMVQFDGDTLAQAVEEFNRYRATPLVIGDPAIASLRVGGTFQVNRSNDFVEALESSFGVRAVAGSDDSVILVAADGD